MFSLPAPPMSISMPPWSLLGEAAMPSAAGGSAAWPAQGAARRAEQATKLSSGAAAARTSGGGPTPAAALTITRVAHVHAIHARRTGQQAREQGEERPASNVRHSNALRLWRLFLMRTRQRLWLHIP